MAKTTLRQIEDRLRAMFTPGEQRKLVFWYDESASFENEVSTTFLFLFAKENFSASWVLPAPAKPPC